SLSWRLTSDPEQRMHWNLRLGRDFRLPGLNDLFWQPGGKRDLQPEVAYGQEAAWHYRTAGWGQWRLVAFNRWVRNWIQWSQLRSGIFAVDNITRVWSRGLQLHWQQQRGAWHLGAKAQYVRATYQVAIENPRISPGEQLWYTPSWQASARLGWQHRGWRFRYQHQYTGATAGISTQLSAYQLATIQVDYHSDWEKLPWRIHLALHNCWNATYQIIEFRPIPGRQLQVGVKLQLTHKLLPTARPRHKSINHHATN
ncbi:MAG: TonB-dependent receptor, partial [Bacteroidetes bacterium]